ncbi:hypothetical protein OROHE_012274 [Orobanche hederae]
MDQGLIKYEDESPVDAKGMGRMILDQVYELSLLGSNLCTMVRRALPQNKLEFTVVLADASPSRGVGADSPRVDGSPGESDRKGSSRQPYSQMYKVAVNFAAKIPVHAIANALRRQDSEHFQGAVRVPDITLRQNVAQKMLRNLRIEDEQTFSLRQGRGGSSDAQEINVTVYDYFVNHHNIRLRYSGDYPCINTGKPKCPIYIPIEVCSLVSLQCYTKASYQILSKAAGEYERLTATLSSNNYAADSLLAAASTDFTQIQGRILAVPKLVIGKTLFHAMGDGTLIRRFFCIRFWILSSFLLSQNFNYRNDVFSCFFVFVPFVLDRGFFIFVAFLLDRGSWVLQFSVVCQSIDLRHFTPDLTGYITEGQLYIDSQLHNWSNSDLDFLWHLALSTEVNETEKQVNTNSSSKPSNASVEEKGVQSILMPLEKQVNTNSSSKTSNASVEEEGVQSILMPLVAKWM